MVASPLGFERAASFLDSCESIWNDLLQSLLQDTISLSDSARASFYALAQSVDSLFSSHLLDARTRLNDRSERSMVFLTERIHREQARLADTMLMLFDSLSSAFEALLPAKKLVRTVPSQDYEDVLNALLENRIRTHRLHFSTAYQSRSVWRGIEQNSGNGAYLLSATYQHRTGIFLSASLLRLKGQTPLIDQASASVGVDYQAFDHFLLSLAYSRYHYSDSSVQARAFITSDLTLGLSFQTEWLTPSVMLLWAFSDEGEKFFCSWDISHAFLLSQFSWGKWVIVPSVGGEYGTISMIDVERQRRTRQNPEAQPRIQQSSPFVLTNYLFSLSLLYGLGNLSVVPELSLLFLSTFQA